MDETGFLNKLGDTAGGIIRQYFRKGFAIEAKKAHDPVTEADQKTEKALRELIAQTYPTDTILGEEYGHTAGTSSRTWVIDPIDGTRAFAVGRATFTTVIALCENDEPVAGLLDQPIVGDRWIGVKGKQTTFNGVPCQTRKSGPLETTRMIMTSPGQFQTQAQQHAMSIVMEKAGFTTFGGDCYAYGFVASGFADGVLEAGLQPHDIMGLVAIVEGAGGIITDWQGQRPSLKNCTGEILACGDATLHQRLLALIAA